MNHISKVLVSVVVISYNSEKTITETLDSAKRQTYRPLELVVSDDCSTDRTQEIVRDWIKENRGSFDNVIFQRAKQNVGIVRNVDSAVRRCNGEWVKPIAADDMLIDDCIEQYMALAERDSCDFCFGSELLIDDSSKVFGRTYAPNYRMKKIVGLKPMEQYRKMAFDYITLAPSFFYRKEAFIGVGGYDKRFKIIEDYAFLLSLFKHGYIMDFCEKDVIKYRVHNSISRNHGKIYIPRQEKDRIGIKKAYCYPYMPPYRIDFWLSELNDWVEILVFMYLFGNSPNTVTRVLKPVFSIFNPRKWYRLIVDIKARAEYQGKML